nr:multiheme c-type cytochrome [Nannocystis pusilla]
MQVYWVESPRDRRLHAFPSAWLTDEQKWVPVESTLLRPPQGDVVYTWNRACVPCHAVAGQPRIDDERVDTRVAELGIACESCHGPGRAHVDARRSPLARYALHLSSEPDPSIVHPARLDHRRSAELCGQCHGVARFPDEDTWLARGDTYRPGEPLAPHRQLVRHPVREAQPWLDEVLDEDPEYLAGRMWSDGHVRVTGREYTALLETPCFQRGELSCLSCHQLTAPTPTISWPSRRAATQPVLRAMSFRTSRPTPATRPAASRVTTATCRGPPTACSRRSAATWSTAPTSRSRSPPAAPTPAACATSIARWRGPRATCGPGTIIPSPSSTAISGPSPRLSFGPSRATPASGPWPPTRSAAARSSAPTGGRRSSPTSWRTHDAVRQIAARGLRRLPSAAGVQIDPLAPADARAAAATEVLTRWRAVPRPGPDPARLVDATGDHDVAALQALADRRDDRPIDLKE